MRKILLFTAALTLLPAGAAQARKAPPAGTPASMQSLLACRAIADTAQRLACFDRAAATVADALAKKDLVMMDRAKATQAKKALFGFSIPNFGGLFGGGEDDIKEISSTVSSFSQNGYLGWTIKLADGRALAWEEYGDRGRPIFVFHDG